MKFLDEYRDFTKAQNVIKGINRILTRSWTLMEVCGGQTHSIVKYGLDGVLPSGIELVHGPGCPVCVTSLEMIDKAHSIASLPDVIFCSFGDMLRVPGSVHNLLTLKAQGKDIRVVYSPLDAVRIAETHPNHRVVFFAVGFETTAPANAMAVWMAQKKNLKNFSVLISHVLVPPAISAILQSPDNRVQGFLGPGHVCTIVGYSEYIELVQNHRVPIVITGFEPVDLLEGIFMLVRLLETGQARVENQYTRVVKPEGNLKSRQLLDQIFEVCDRPWRGIGVIPRSGLKLKPEYHAYDAERLFDVGTIQTQEPRECISGEILKGQKKPSQCPAFGTSCTPLTPLGATMVSSEGACAAYYAYGRHLASQAPTSKVLPSPDSFGDSFGDSSGNSSFGKEKPNPHV